MKQWPCCSVPDTHGESEVCISDSGYSVDFFGGGGESSGSESGTSESVTAEEVGKNLGEEKPKRITERLEKMPTKPAPAPLNVAEHALLAAAGDTTVKEDLLKGRQAIGRDYKVHLDGYNLMPFLSGDEETSPRKEFLYWTDDGNVAALRYND